MRVEVLVSAMNQKDFSLLDKMNIETDSIIINQSDRNEVEEFNYGSDAVKFLSFNERGVGLSRNNALMRTTADIAIFSDEDVVFEDGYSQMVENVFRNNPQADVIIFNIESANPERPLHEIKKPEKVKWFNCLKYGAARIAVRPEKIKEANIYFSLLFGGGAKYSAGEDSLFVADCVKKGLNVYAYPKVIGRAEQQASTWFNGYDEKYFIDKGVFFKMLSSKFARLFALQYVVRKEKLFRDSMSRKQAYQLMIKGIKTAT